MRWPISPLPCHQCAALETIRRKKFGLDAARLQEIIAARQIGGLVLGLPFNMDGSEGPRCQSTRAFARNLERLVDLPITFWDERLSTVAAERALLEADTSRKRRAEVIDHVAAGYILQGALDRLRVIRSAAVESPSPSGPVAQRDWPGRTRGAHPRSCTTSSSRDQKSPRPLEGSGPCLHLRFGQDVLRSKKSKRQSSR